MFNFIVLVFASFFFVDITALKCIQGSHNTSFPTPTVATECSDPKAITCVTMYDSSSLFATHMCSNSNCTLNGGYVAIPICVNASSTKINCCCHTDSCNAAMLGQALSFVPPTKPPPPSNQTSAAAAAAIKPLASQGKCEKGFQLLTASADASISSVGKFAGYFPTSQSSCEQLCDRNFGLINCVAIMYEQKNRGKCTIFQNPIDDRVVESPASFVSVLKKC